MSVSFKLHIIISQSELLSNLNIFNKICQSRLHFTLTKSIIIYQSWICYKPIPCQKQFTISHFNLNYIKITCNTEKHVYRNTINSASTQKYCTSRITCFFLYCNFDENMGRGWDYVIIKTNSRRKDILNPQNLRISKLVRIEIDIVI